jgi:hypothetical protein
MTSQEIQTLASQQATRRNSEVIDRLLWLLQEEPEMILRRKEIFDRHAAGCTCAYHYALAYYTHYKIRIHRLLRRIYELIDRSPSHNCLCQQLEFARESARVWKERKDKYLSTDEDPWPMFLSPPRRAYEDFAEI